MSSIVQPRDSVLVSHITWMKLCCGSFFRSENKERISQKFKPAIMDFLFTASGDKLWGITTMSCHHLPSWSDELVPKKTTNSGLVTHLTHRKHKYLFSLISVKLTNPSPAFTIYIAPLWSAQAPWEKTIIYKCVMWCDPLLYNNFWL